MDEGTTSPQRQRRTIERWCAERGIELVETFEDFDLSAFNGRRRPGLERMLGRLGDVKWVVSWRLDRLARSVSGFSKLIDRLEEAGVKLATTDGQVDMSSAAGRAMVQMTAVFAELEAGTTSERARQMHAYKHERGDWVGQVPRGVRRSGKTIEPDPEQFGEIEEAASRHVAGESLRRIALDIGIHHPNLARMLRSDRVVEALPPELGARLVQELAHRGRTGSRAVRSLLGGIARCGECEGAMTIVGTRSGGNGRKTGPPTRAASVDTSASLRPGSTPSSQSRCSQRSTRGSSRDASRASADQRRPAPRQSSRHGSSSSSATSMNSAGWHAIRTFAGVRASSVGLRRRAQPRPTKTSIFRGSLHCIYRNDGRSCLSKVAVELSKRCSRACPSSERGATGRLIRRELRSTGVSRREAWPALQTSYAHCVCNTRVARGIWPWRCGRET